MKNEACRFSARFAFAALAVFACLALAAAPANAKTLKCYDAWDDQDGDGHARIGALVTEVPVGDHDDTCPTGYRDVADDCDDGNRSIHPRAIETPYDGVSQNCDAEPDRPDFRYDPDGTDNGTNSINITVWLKHRDIQAAAFAGTLYAQIRYFALRNEGALTTTARSRVMSFDPWKDRAVLTLSGLTAATVYAVRVLFWNRDSGGTFTRVGPDSVRYYTMTDSSIDNYHKRFQMVMKGLFEYRLSQLGYVGTAGTPDPNGTRYGAGLHRAWCSEFYVWVTRGWLDGIAGLDSYTELRDYFDDNGILSNLDTARLEHAPVGSYLLMDASRDGDADHSGMLLDYDPGTGKVWSLEGNASNEVRVVDKQANLTAEHPRYLKIGYITNEMWR